MLYKIIDFLISRRYFLAVSSIFIVIFSVAGFSGYKMTLDYRAYFNNDNPHMLAYQQIQERYSHGEPAILAITNKSGSVFEKPFLKAIKDITERAWLIPYTTRVDSLTNFPYVIAEGDDLTTEEMFKDADALSSEEFTRRSEFSRNEPRINRILVSEDASTSAVYITLNLPGQDLESEVPETVKALYELKDFVVEQYPFVDVNMAGQVVYDDQFPQASKQNFKELYPILFLVMIVLMVVVYRSVSAMFVTLAVVFLAMFSGFGALGWLGLEINPVVVTAPIMIMTLGIADCVHLITSYRAELLNLDRLAAMRNALHANFKPIVITTVLTALGFLTLNLSESPPFRVLGNIVALGAVFALLFTFLLCPALLLLLPAKWLRQQADSTFGTRVLAIAERHKVIIALVTLGVVAASVTGLQKNQINDDFIKYFGESMDFRKDMDYVHDKMGGLVTLSYSFETDQEWGVTEPQYLANLQAYVDWLNAQPEVVSAVSLSDVLKRINRSMHNGSEDYYVLPESRELAAQYLMVYEMTLPQGLDMTNEVTIDKRASRVRVLLNTTAGQDILAFEKRSRDWIRQNLPESMSSNAAGTGVMFAYIGQENIDSMVVGLAFSLVLVALILCVLMGTFRLVLICLVANLLPVLIGFGIWGYVNGNIDIGLSVVLGIAFGIVVDDTVHLLVKYQQAYDSNGGNSLAAIRYAVRSVGKSIFATSLIVACGFAVLLWSAFNLTVHMALLTIIIVVVAVLVDLFVVPALFLWRQGPTIMLNEDRALDMTKTSQ